MKHQTKEDVGEDTDADAHSSNHGTSHYTWIVTNPEYMVRCAYCIPAIQGSVYYILTVYYVRTVVYRL